MVKTPPAEAGDRRDWRPMRPYRGKRNFEISDPLVEPLWSGVRVIAHVHADGERDPDVTLIEDMGADLAPELPDVTTALGRSVMAVEAIIDGVITNEVGLQGIGAAAVPEVRGSATSLIMRSNASLDVRRRALPGDEPEEEKVEGFVAVDLLSVDGTSLLDIPLLERKRILESVIEQSKLVRVSIQTRPPIDTWVTTWKALGLRGAILKAANSRYQPGGDSIEWRTVETVGRRG